MANAGEVKCLSNPEFAVICSFLDKYGEKLGLPAIGYANLQEWIEDSRRVHPTLIEVHVRLLRKAINKGFNLQSDRWEKGLVRFCHRYSAVDAWEIERFGYKIAKVSTKLTLLKDKWILKDLKTEINNLLETQFDSNTKFKEKLNDEKAEDMRCRPLGRDKDGLAYWYFLDNELNLRIFREDQDDVADETWELVCRTRDDLAKLIDNLEKGFDTKLEKQEQSELSEQTSDTNEDSRDSFYSSKQKGGIGPSPLTIKQEPADTGTSDTPGSETDTNAADSKIVLKIKQGKCEVDSPTKQLKDKFVKEKGLQLKKIKCKLKREEIADGIEEDDYNEEEDEEDNGADTGEENIESLEAEVKDSLSEISNQKECCVKDIKLGTEIESENKTENQQNHKSKDEAISLVSDVKVNDLENKKPQSDSKVLKSIDLDMKEVIRKSNGACDTEISLEQSSDRTNLEKSHTHTAISKKIDKTVNLDQDTPTISENSIVKEVKNEISQDISVDESSVSEQKESYNDIEKGIEDNTSSPSEKDSSNKDSCYGSKSEQKIDTNLPQLVKPCDTASSIRIGNKDSNDCSESVSDEISSNGNSSINPNDALDNQKVETKDGDSEVKLEKNEPDKQSNSISSKHDEVNNSNTTKCNLSIKISETNQMIDISIKELKDESASDHLNTKFDVFKDNCMSQKLDKASENSSCNNLKDLGNADIQDKVNDSIISDTKSEVNKKKESQKSLKSSDREAEIKEQDKSDHSKDLLKEGSKATANGKEKGKSKIDKVESNLLEVKDDLVENDKTDTKQSSMNDNKVSLMPEDSNVKSKTSRKRKKDEISNTPNESSTDDEPEMSHSPEAKARKIKTAVRKSTDLKEMQCQNDSSARSSKEENGSTIDNSDSKLTGRMTDDKESKTKANIDSGNKDNLVNKNKKEEVEHNHKEENEIEKPSEPLPKTGKKELVKKVGVLPAKASKPDSQVESDGNEVRDIEMVDGSDLESESLEDKKTIDSNDKGRSDKDSKGMKGKRKEAANTKDKAKKKNKQSSSEDDLSASEGNESITKGVRSKAQKRQVNESPEESPTEPALKRSKLRGRVLLKGRGKRYTQESPTDNSSSTEDDDIPLSQMAGRGRKGRGKGRGKGIGARRKKSQPRKEGTAVKKKKVDDEEAFGSASEPEQKPAVDKKSSAVKTEGETGKDLDDVDNDIEDVPLKELINNKKSKDDKEGMKPSKDIPIPSDDEPGVRRSARVRSLRARKKKSPSQEYFPSENEEPNNDDDYEFDCDEDLDDDEEFSLRRKRKPKPTPVEEEVPKGRNALRYEAKTSKRSKKVQEEEEEEEAEDETPCCKCLKNEQPEWILLCDKCDAGYHTACLRPPLMVIPDGDWFCPPCEQNDLVLKLTENLKNLNQSILKNDRLQRRKERLAFVSISLDNVLKEDSDSFVKKSPGKAKQSAQRSKKSKTKHDFDSSGEDTEEEESESSSRSSSDNSRSSESDRPRSRSCRSDRKRRRQRRRQSSQSEEESPPPRFVQRKCRSRNPVSYKFEEFEEMIADAIHDDISIPKEPKPKKVKPLGISRGKDMSNILGVSDEESKPKAKKKRKPRLTELDEEFDDDDDTDDYEMSDASRSSSASKSYQSDASDLSGEESVGRRESRRGTRRSSRRNGRRFGRYRDDFVVDSDFDSAEERQAVRRPRRKTAKYVDYNTETEEEESLATSDLDDSDFEQKRKKKLKKKQKKSKTGSGKRQRIKRVSTSEGSESESEDTAPSKNKKAGKKRSEDENSGSESEEEAQKETTKTVKKKVTRRIEDSEESSSSEDEDDSVKKITHKDTDKQAGKIKKSKNVIETDSEEDLDESSNKKGTKKEKDETSSDNSNDDNEEENSSSEEDSESDESNASNQTEEDEEGWEEIGAGSADDMSSPRAKKSPSHASKEKLPGGKLMYATVVAKKLSDVHLEKFSINLGDTKTSDESASKIGDTKTPKESASKEKDFKTSDKTESELGDPKADEESSSKVNDTKKLDESSSKLDDTKTSDKLASTVDDRKTLDESARKITDNETSDKSANKVGDGKTLNESACKGDDNKTLDESENKVDDTVAMGETNAKGGNKIVKPQSASGTGQKQDEVTPKKRGRKPKKLLEDTGPDTQGEESPVKKKRGKKSEVVETPTNNTSETKPELTEKSEDKTESDKTVEKKDDSPLQSRKNQNAPVGVVKPEVRQGVIVENKHVIDARAVDTRSNENMVSPLQGMREMAMRNQGNQGPDFGNFGPYQGSNNGPFPNRGMDGGYMGPQGFQNYPQGQGQGPYGQGMQGPMQGHPYGGMPPGHSQGMPQQQGPMNQGGPINPNQQPQTNYPQHNQGQGPLSPNTYHQNNQYMPPNIQQPPAGYYQGPYQMGPEGQQNYGYGGQGPQKGPPYQNYPQGNFSQGQFQPPGYHPQHGPFPPSQMQGPPYMNQQGPQPQMGPQGQFQGQQGPPYQNTSYNYPHVPQPRHPPGYGPQPRHIQGGNQNQPFRPEPQAPGPQYHQLQSVDRQGIGSPGQVNSPNQGMGSPQMVMGSPGTAVSSPGAVKPASQTSDQKPSTNTVHKEETKPQTSNASQEKQETDKPSQDSAKEPSPKTQAVEPTQRKGFMMANILKPKSEQDEEQPSSKSSE